MVWGELNQWEELTKKIPNWKKGIVFEATTTNTAQKDDKRLVNAVHDGKNNINLGRIFVQKNGTNNYLQSRLKSHPLPHTEHQKNVVTPTFVGILIAFVRYYTVTTLKKSPTSLKITGLRLRLTSVASFLVEQFISAKRMRIGNKNLKDSMS